MGSAYILAIDQSTQSTKAMLFDDAGRVVAHACEPHRQIIERGSFVSHDLNEIAANILAVSRRVIESAGIDKAAVKAIGVTNQRESVGVWDRATGAPIANSIVWQCNRAAGITDALSAEEAEYVTRTTGLKLSPFFSAPKLAWLLNEVPGARERAKRGELCCGTMDCFTVFVLTGGKSHRTDLSNASRMLLLNLDKGEWDERLTNIFDIPAALLPEIMDSDACFGWSDLGGYLDAPIPIRAALGDSHAALFAAGCHEAGDCMAGYGTGTCVMMNLGYKPVRSDKGINTSVAWRAGGNTLYLFDGVINYSGAVITWIVDELKLAASPAQTETLARQADPTDRTYLIPYFTGASAPRWSNGSNAIFCGMTRSTGRAELVRAALESLAYQTADVVFAMSEAAKQRPVQMRVSGGPTKNAYLMQFQADLLDLEVLAPENKEMTLQGAAYMAGIAAGVYAGDLVNSSPIAEKYSPTMGKDERLLRLAGWERAASAAIKMQEERPL
ncbi:MAG: glycerol kinase GlpK [Clostridia bacterium]|nr:glycerol kinase GlpK [Clostridia bacterium]